MTVDPTFRMESIVSLMSEEARTALLTPSPMSQESVDTIWCFFGLTRQGFEPRNLRHSERTPCHCAVGVGGGLITVFAMLVLVLLCLIWLCLMLTCPNSYCKSSYVSLQAYLWNLCNPARHFVTFRCPHCAWPLVSLCSITLLNHVISLLLINQCYKNKDNLAEKSTAVKISHSTKTRTRQDKMYLIWFLGILAGKTLLFEIDI